MNIFDLYLEKIIKIVKLANKNKNIEIPEKLNGINVDIPPSQFNCDISTNVAMILAKPNKKTPIEIANQLVDLIKKGDDQIEDVLIAKPGFINIKFKNTFWNGFLKEVISDDKKFGVNKKISKKKIFNRIRFCKSYWATSCRSLSWSNIR